MEDQRPRLSASYHDGAALAAAWSGRTGDANTPPGLTRDMKLGSHSHGLAQGITAERS